MRAADLVKSIWGSLPAATTATSATQDASQPPLSQVSQLSQRAGGRNLAALSQLSQVSQQAEHGNLADLLARYPAEPRVSWDGLALTDAQESSLWIVQRPGDGALTVIVGAEPFARPAGYPAAWPARFTTPEPADDAPPVVQQATAEAIGRAARHCWGCRFLDTLSRPDDKLPHCAVGHRLVWRELNPGRSTTPTRTDAKPCGDWSEEDAND